MMLPNDPRSMKSLSIFNQPYFVSQYGHDQVFPSFITWYTNWTVELEYSGWPIKRIVLFQRKWFDPTSRATTLGSMRLMILLLLHKMLSKLCSLSSEDKSDGGCNQNKTVMRAVQCSSSSGCRSSVMNLEHPDHILEEVNKEDFNACSHQELDYSIKPYMVDKDKGKSKNPLIRKRNLRPTLEGPFGSPCLQTIHRHTQSHNASTHVAPQSGYTISTPTVVPSSVNTKHCYLFTSLAGSNIPSSSASQCNSLNTSSGSIRLSNLHIESNGSSLILPPPNTQMHIRSYQRQFSRLIIGAIRYKYDLIIFHLSFIYLYFN
ncbi:hypothetical protein H5410_032875 [Solanum commersonii]|uniref:Uncharacterized protein n=1 Tax=Solanum commersonii TaxID=4109 RepID=A0A9J5YM80_SOLCO|nr:hypothetical protein H5410_032875 [Solanum commersonii]